MKTVTRPVEVFDSVDIGDDNDVVVASGKFNIETEV